MEIKKSISASLENKKNDFLLMGLTVALGFLYIAFEWTQTDVKKFEDTVVDEVFTEEEMIEVTVQEELPPPPPQQVQAPPVVLPEINTVEDDVQVKDVEIATTEDDGSAVEQAPIVQQQEEEIEEEEIFSRVEENASFPGGNKAMMEYLMKNLKYPTICQESGIQGKVFVSFTVNKDGSIQDVKVTRGVHEKLDEEAVRVVKSMPKWTPGKMQGRAVRSKFNLPVTFKLKE